MPQTPRQRLAVLERLRRALAGTGLQGVRGVADEDRSPVHLPVWQLRRRPGRVASFEGLMVGGVLAQGLAGFAWVGCLVLVLVLVFVGVIL